VSGLKISETLELPADLGDRKIAILAQSKAGKTYGLGDILEELYLANRPFAAFDPANNLWGLRCKPDGSPSDFDIVVIGGDHADIPLEKDAGERIAEALISEPVCAVIDVAFESKTTIRRFVTDFCNRSMQTRVDIPRVYVFEEAPEFVPQSANYPGIQVCKAAVDSIDWIVSKNIEVLIERPELTRVQLATLGGVSFKSSTFRNYLSWLKRNGLVETPDFETVKLRAM
jgi:hypothetical protein